MMSFSIRSWLAVFVAFCCLMGFHASTSAQESFSWGFDGPTSAKDWIAYSFKNGTDYKRIVEVVSTQPYRGSGCLQVRDEMSDANPYAVNKIPIDPSRSYTFSGWVRGEKKASGCHIAPIALLNERGEGVKWFLNPKFDVDTTWKPFSITIQSIPSDIRMLGLSLSATRDLPMEATGIMWFDELRFEPTPMTCLDMKQVANMDFRDEQADDGQGGWTDQGPQDLRYFKPGNQWHGNVQFNIIDPSANSGKAVLALGNRTPFASSSQLSVRKTADYLYLFHTAAWATKEDTLVGYVDIQYQSGKQQTLRIVAGDQLSDWFRGPSKNSAAILLAKPNDRMEKALLHVTSIRNPSPSERIESIQLRASDDPSSKAIWLVLGATLGQGSDLVEKSQWIEDTLLAKGSEMESLGLIDSRSLKVDTVPLRLTPGDSVDVRASLGSVLRRSNKNVAGVAFHRVGGFGNGPYHTPYHRETGEYMLKPEHERAIQQLRVPMTRFYSVGCESFGVHGALDRVAKLVDTMGIPQENTVIELELHYADEKLAPSVWADAVAYVRQKGYGFRYWEIGNEISWARTKVVFPTVNEYVDHFKAVSQAIRKEQPQAKIGISAEHGNALWGNYLLKATAGYYDYVVFHWYEFKEVPGNIEESVVGYNHVRINEILQMSELLKRYNPNRSVEQIDTEWGRHVYPPKRDQLHRHSQNDNILGVLYQAVRMVYYGREKVIDAANCWSMMVWKEHYECMGFVSCDVPVQTTMKYWFFYYYNRHFGDRILDISGTAPCLKSTIPQNQSQPPIPLTPLMVTASDDGEHVYVVAVNASWTQDYPCQIQIDGFTPGSAEAVVLSDDDLNGSMWVKDPAKFIRPLNVQLVSSAVKFQLPKHSMVFVTLKRSSLASGLFIPQSEAAK